MGGFGLPYFLVTPQRAANSKSKKSTNKQRKTVNKYAANYLSAKLITPP